MKEAHKHRLIGAAILTAVAVLFLPSFFKDNQPYSVNIESQIPQRPSVTALSFREPEVPEGIDLAAAPEAMFVGDEAADSISLPPPSLPLPEDVELTSREPEGSKAVASSSSQMSSAPMLAQVTTPAMNEKGLITGYVVRVASLSSKDLAEDLEARLLSMGYKAYVRSAPLANGFTYRVFVGPFLEQSEAAGVKQKLDVVLSVDAWVHKFEP